MAARKKTTKASTIETELSAGDLLRELPGAKAIHYESGALIFREGSKATNCFIVVEGRVRVLKRSARGENISLAIVRRGEFLGEMAMLSGDRRSASAVAATRVKAVVIDHDEFINLLQARHPFASRLSFQLSKLLAVRCQRLLKLIARQPDLLPAGDRRVPRLDVRAVLNRVYTLWAV